MKRSRTLVLLLSWLLILPLPQAQAKRPHRIPGATKVTVGKFGDPTKLPADKAETLVTASRIPAFYDPADLSREPVVSAKSAVLLDAASGEILYAKNPDMQLYPASTTKIMTGLLLAERTQPDDIITCTDVKIRSIEESSLHIQPWEKFTSRDLLYGTLLRSANDGSVVIAEHVGGSIEKFADLMNQRAVEAGATNTHFHNPNGLPDTEHYTTAHDLAVIARAALANERFRDAVKIRTRVIARSKSKDTTVSSKAKKFYETFPGADGVKTGFTRAARHCFVGSATRDGRQLIGVVLSAASDATGEVSTILGWGFRRFPPLVALKAGASAPPVAVLGGEKNTVLTVAGADLVTFSDTTKPEPVVQTVAEPMPGLASPITKGQNIGRLVVRVDNQDRGSVPLLADETIAIAPTIVIAKKAGSFFGLVGKILLAIMGAGVVFLIGLACYGTTTTKSARRRRNRFSPQSRGIDNGGPREGERRDSNGSGNERGPGARRDHR